MSWGQSGTDPGEFNTVHNIAIDSNGRVYVADRENHRVQVFSSTGEFQSQWVNMAMASCIWIDQSDNGLVYVGEFYAGIPGTIGGAIKMNAGCYGSETKRVLKNIKTINNKGKINFFTNNQLNLKYRGSSLSDNDIVISAQYKLEYGEKEEIDKNIHEIKLKREQSQPLRTKTGGSTFKNPENNYAAKLIEMAGCKKLNVGDAYVSAKHANFLINTNKASAKDIEELGLRIIDKVFDKFQIKLEWEIKIVGETHK